MYQRLEVYAASFFNRRCLCLSSWFPPILEWRIPCTLDWHVPNVPHVAYHIYEHSFRRCVTFPVSFHELLLLPNRNCPGLLCLSNSRIFVDASLWATGSSSAIWSVRFFTVRKRCCNARSPAHKNRFAVFGGRTNTLMASFTDSYSLSTRLYRWCLPGTSNHVSKT